MNQTFCIRRWIVFAALAALIVGGFLFGKCQSSKFSQQRAQIDSLTLTLQTRDSLVNAKNQQVVTQAALLTEDQAALKKLTQDVFNLKKSQARKIKEVIAYYSQITQAHLDSVGVPYKDTIAMEQFSDSLRKQCGEIIEYMAQNTITVPRTAVLDTAGLHLDITVTKEPQIRINQISITDSQYVRIVVKKGGFFRKVNGKLKFHVPKSIEFQTLHTSPLVHVIGQTSILYQPPVKANILGKVLLIGAGVLIGLQF